MQSLLVIFGLAVLLLVIVPVLIYLTGWFAMRYTRKSPIRPETIVHLTPLNDHLPGGPPAT